MNFRAWLSWVILFAMFAVVAHFGAFMLNNHVWTYWAGLTMGILIAFITAKDRKI